MNMAYFLKNQLQSEDTCLKAKATALWGLAAYGQPVLLDVNNIETSDDTVINAYLAMALYEMGDKTRAKEMLVDILEHMEDLSGKEQALVATTALLLNIEDERFTENYSLNVISQDTIVLEKLYYIKNYPVDFSEATFDYTLNGQSETVELPDLDSYRIELKEGDDITFNEVSEDLMVNEWLKVLGTDYKDYKNSKYQIKQEAPEQVNFGDRVTVNVRFQKGQKDWVVIRTRIPAGFEYVGSKGDCSVYVDNQELVAYAGYEDFSFEYYLSANQAGTYNMEPITIQNMYESELYMSDPSMIEVIND
jgi:hypothetical protein